MLPAAAKLVEMRCATQGFLRTAEDGVKMLAVSVAIVEAYMYAHRCITNSPASRPNPAAD